MHIITPYNPWAPKKKKTWQEELWEQNEIAEAEARMLAMLAEASSKTLPDNAPAIAAATVGPMVNAQAGGGGVPVPAYFTTANDIIDFSGTPETADAPVTVVFTNLTTTPDFDTYFWDFGDGTAYSSEINPTHIYQTGSAYTVTLYVSHSNGDVSSSLKTAYISASIPVVTAGFTYVTSSGPGPITASFTNTTTNTSQTATTTYKWRFGDGATSTLTSPSRAYVLTGSITASLESTGSYAITSLYTQSFYVPAPTVTALFTFASSSLTGPTTMSFTNTSTNNGNGTLGYWWEFGSASLSSSSTSPSQLYTATGGFTASLAVTESKYGRTSYYTQSFYIPAPSVTAAFTFTTTSNAAPSSASFTSTSVYNGGGALNYLWTFGSASVTSTAASPSTVYTAPGGYTASLAVTESSYKYTSYTSSMFYLA